MKKSMLNNKLLLLSHFILFIIIISTCSSSPPKNTPLYFATLIAQNSKDVDERNENLSFVAGSYAEIKDYDNAMKIIRMIDDTMEQYDALNYIVSIYAQDSEYTRAIQITDMIKNYYQKSQALLRIAAGQFRNGQINWSDMLSKSRILIDSIQDDTLKLKTLVNISLDYAQINDTIQAIKVLEQATDLYKTILNTASKNYLINILQEIAESYGIIGRKDLSCIYLNDAVAIALTLKEMYRDNRLFDIAQSYVHLGLFKSAIEITDSINYPPKIKENVQTQIVAEYVKNNQMSKAINLAESIEYSGYKSNALVNIYQKLITDKEYDRAQKILNEITDSLNKAGCYMYLSNQYLKIGDTLKATEYLGYSQIYISLEMNEFVTGAILTRSAELYYKIGQPEKSNEILSRSFKYYRDKDTLIQSSLLTMISNAYVDIGQYTQALATINEIKEPRNKIFSLMHLNFNLLKHEQRLDKQSIRLLNKMIKETR